MRISVARSCAIFCVSLVLLASLAGQFHLDLTTFSVSPTFKGNWSTTFLDGLVLVEPPQIIRPTDESAKERAPLATPYQPPKKPRLQGVKVAAPKNDGLSPQVDEDAQAKSKRGPYPGYPEFYPLAPPEPDCYDDSTRKWTEAAAAAAAADRNRPEGCEDVGQWAERVVAEQLLPWKDGYTQDSLNGALRYRPRIAGDCLANFRNGSFKSCTDSAWTLYMRRAVSEWPLPASDMKDFSVVYELADWPFLWKDDEKTKPPNVGPAFTASNNGNFWNLMMPSHSRPVFDNGFEKVREKALEVGSAIPFSKRRDAAVWRGCVGCSMGCGPRGRAYYPTNHVPHCYADNADWSPDEVGIPFGCADDSTRKAGAWMRHPRWAAASYSATCGKICGVDAVFQGGLEGGHAKFVRNYTGPNVSRWTAQYMTDEQTASARYVFNIGNNGYADRSWRMFMFGGIVFLPDTGWIEWYYSLIKPWVHYIPVKADFSDVCEKIRFLRANPDNAEAIAIKGRAFAEQCMTLKTVNRYVAEVMRQLGQLWRG